MKKILFFFLINSFIVACSRSPQKRAEYLIRQELKEGQKIAEYQPLTFELLTKAKYEVYQQREFLELEAKANKYMELAKLQVDYIGAIASFAPSEMMLSEKNKAEEYLREEQLLDDSITKLKKNFAPDTTCYMLAHTYMYKNKKTNKTEKADIIFYFDKDISNITGILHYTDSTWIYDSYKRIIYERTHK